MRVELGLTARSGTPDRFTALLVVIEGLTQTTDGFSRCFKERLCFGIAHASNIVPTFLPGLLKHLLDSLRMLLWCHLRFTALHRTTPFFLLFAPLGFFPPKR